MKENLEDRTSEMLSEMIVDAIQEIKGEEIVRLDLRGLENAVTDFFVICTGTSNTHVDAIAGSVEREIKTQISERPFRVEGTQNSEWVLMDYINVVVHVFRGETREFYNLEELWADAEVKHYDETAV